MTEPTPLPAAVGAAGASAAGAKPDFAALVAAIAGVHRSLAEQAARAVNVSLTLRNWLVGAYIQEYEQQGADRAQYGDALLDRLSLALAATGTLSYHPRELRRCRAFYLAYPQIRGSLSPELSLAGVDSQLFISKYPQAQPRREETVQFLIEKLRAFDNESL